MQVLKILLCQSYLGQKSGEPRVFPLGLSYLASLIKDEHELYCYDPNVAQDPLRELSALINKINPDVVGLSLRNIDSSFSYAIRSYYPSFVSQLKVIRENAPSCKLVVGGTGFSLFAEEIMKRNSEIDMGIMFEGEVPFAELLKNFDNPERIKNLIFRKNGKLVFTGKREWIDPDCLPFPSRELFEMKEYLKYPFSIGVSSNRGCGMNCIYCPVKFIMGGFFRLRSPKKVVDEIQLLNTNFGVNDFFFTDELFCCTLDHARAICKEIIKRKLDIRWRAEFNPAYLNLLLMEESVKAGCDLFNFSLDGASNNSLNFLGKNFDVNSIKKTINLTRQVDGANIGFSFLYDLPKHNAEHTLGLVSLIPKAQFVLGRKLRYVSLSRMRIYPYTSLCKKALEEGKISENTDLLNPTYYTSNSLSNPSNFFPNILRYSSFLFDKISRPQCHN